MNDQSDRSNSLHLPLGLIAAAFAIFLGAQVGATSQNTRFAKFQIETLEKGIANMQANDKQLAEAIKNREGVVKQSGELQTQLQTLLNELLDLAKDDKDAQEIIKKWNVQRNTPPGGAAAAAAPADAAKPAADSTKKTP